MNPLQRTNSLLAVVHPSIQDYQDLKKLIGELNRAYYIASKSIIDDELYDALFKQLIAWEERLPLGDEELADSPSQKAYRKSNELLSKSSTRPPYAFLVQCL